MRYFISGDNTSYGHSTEFPAYYFWSGHYLIHGGGRIKSKPFSIVWGINTQLLKSGAICIFYGEGILAYNFIFLQTYNFIF